VADRKQFLGDMSPDPRLTKLLEATAGGTVTEEVLREQKISFAFGNAPADAQEITKESVRLACKNLRLRQS
jgi:hypothetical protein